MKNYDLIKMLALTGSVSLIASVVVLIISLPCGFIVLALSVFLNTAFYLYTNKRYEKINELNNYLSLVCSGNFDLDIDDNTEGELSILKNNLYKVITLLRSSNEAVKKEKVNLADSLADISHQLKTPLTSLMVMSEVLKEEESAEKRAEFIDVIENQLEKMNWLISTLLKLSKLDAGTASFNTEKLKISAVVAESLKPFLMTVKLRKIKLITDINDFDFTGDKNWSVEAVGNIIKNCIEHTADEGMLSVCANVTTIYNELIISDNGCGISEKDLPHIFERFYHGANSSKDSVGIGLALSKAIINKQNGIITVSSREGEGTRFSIRFYKSVV